MRVVGVLVDVVTQHAGAIGRLDLGLVGAWVEGQGLEVPPGLNVGLHVGPALAVHAEARGLDWFGRTVNLAARAQSAARDGAIVMTGEVRADSRVDAALTRIGARPEPFTSELKGIGQVSLFRLPR